MLALNRLRVSEATAIGYRAGIRPSVKPGDKTPKAYALEHIQSRIDAIAKHQADGLISRRFEAPVLFALIIHTAALWGTSSPDVLSAVNLTDAGQRRDIVRSAVSALITE